MSQPLSLPEIFGRNVATRREQLHIQQKDLALKLGITQDTLSRIEHGKNFPKPALIEKIAIQLDCSESWLFSRQSEFVSVHSAAICQFLQPLREDTQRALVNFVEHASHVLQKRLI
ncbi:MAG: helix-turn-helix domain-containing protein [Desulfovibrio sp.]|nr:helix-turn-helix domain-containing protein [Desulfovibrio sp.]